MERTAQLRRLTEATDTSNVATQVATQAPLAVLSLLTLPGGATTAVKVAHILGRNYSLVLLMALIGVLFWPTPRDDEETTIIAFKPNGSDEASPSLYRH